ncbi:MAG: glycosyltransferase family 4 protein [Planctomycetota bacterium]|jgi:glycosyltransferase involved in cell wall biosynthesis
MRVLMLDGGDKTPYLSRLVMRLSARGFGMHYAGDPRFKDFEALGAAGVTCHEIEIKHKLDFRARRRIRSLIDEHGIDILHTITSREAYTGIKARGSRPVKIVMRRGAYAPISRFNPADRVTYGRRGADRIVAVSLDLKRQIVSQGIAESRVQQVYTGIWSEELAPRKADLRARYGVLEDALLIGYVGNDRHVKGFDVLVDAMRLLEERAAPVHLLVAGENYDTSRSYPGNLSLVGFVDGVMEFTPNLDAFVIPSRLDALPRAVIEATVVGTPVIGTAVGGIPEILDEGRGGILVPSEDPPALANAIENAAADRDALQALAAHALERNRVLFDVDRCAEIHDELYRSLA